MVRLKKVLGVGIVFVWLGQLLNPFRVYALGDCAKVSLSWVLPNPQEGSEQVEIINISDVEIDLIDWQLDDQEGGSRPISLSGILKQGERQTITLSSAVFNNSGDQVRLICSDQVIDETEYPKADKGLYWVKDSQGNWCFTSDHPKDNFICPSPSPTPTPPPTPLPTAFINPKANCFNLKISRLYPAPADSETEMVKIYNPYKFQVNLTSWQLDDQINQADPIDLSGYIEPEAELVIKLKKSIFNNSGDQVRLLCQAGVVDVVEYDKARQGLIVVRDLNNNACWLSFGYWDVSYNQIDCQQTSLPTPLPIKLVSRLSKQTGESSFKKKNITYQAVGRPVEASDLRSVSGSSWIFELKTSESGGWLIILSGFIIGLYLRRRFKYKIET